MANNTCGGTLRAQAIRGMRLAAGGAPAVGATSKYEHAAPIMVRWKPNVPDPDKFNQQDGVGNNCLYFVGAPQAVDSVDLSIQVCNLDAELIESFCGGSVITVTANTEGYLAPSQATLNTNGTSLELWTWAWAGRNRMTKGGLPAFWHWVFPMTRFAITEQHEMKNGLTAITLTGVGESNSGFGTGLAADPTPVAVTVPWAYYLTSTVPAGACGYGAIP